MRTDIKTNIKSVNWQTALQTDIRTLQEDQNIVTQEENPSK